MAFTDEITALVGSSTANAQIKLAMEAGCSDVVRKVMLTKPDDLWLFTTTSSVTSSGLSVGTGHIYDVSLGSKPAKVIAPELRHRAAETDSINYATAENPVYYLLNSKIYVLPNPGSTANQFTISAFETYDSGNKTKITTSGGNAGDGIHSLTVGDFATFKQSTVGNDTGYVGTYQVVERPSNTTFVIERNYTATVVTGYTVEKVTATASYLASHTVSDPSSDTTISNFPTTYLRYPVLYAAMSVLKTRMNDLHSLLPTLTVDSMPVSEPIELITTSLPSYTPPTQFIPPPLPESVDIDYTGVGTPPIMDSVDAAVMPMLSFDISDIVISNLSITNAPIPPLAEDGTDGVLDFNTVVRSKVPTYVKPTFSVPDFPTIPNLSLPEPPVAPSISAPTDINLQVASTAGNQPSLTIPAMGNLDFSTVETFIVTEEDSELAQAQLQEIQARISEYQARLSSEQLEFNKKMEIYKSIIQEEMEEVKTKMAKENQNVQQDLAKYGAEVQGFQADTNARITEWTKNHLELAYTKWVQEYEKGLGKYTQDMANEMNNFNMQVTEYQAEIAKATADANNSVSVDQNRYARKIQTFQVELDSWKTVVNKEITDWQTRIAQPAMTKFSQIRAENLQSWQTESSNELQAWANRIQYAQQKHSADIGQWQALFTKATTTFSSETGYDMAKYQAEVGTALQQYQSDTDLQGNKFKSDLEKYSSESNQVNAKNSQLQSKFQADIAAHQAKTQADLGKYNADIQKYGVEYKWLTDKYMLINKEYNEGFIPKPQQQEGV